MKYSRRDFIKFGSLAVGLIPAMANLGFGSSGSTGGEVFSNSYSSFHGLIGSEFTFYKNDVCATAALAEVKMFDRAGKGRARECYSLVFEMPSNDFEQDTYEVFHPSIGKFELLSVPGLSKNGSPLLISVINRL